jgi:hypothetical protein
MMVPSRVVMVLAVRVMVMASPFGLVAESRKGQRAPPHPDPDIVGSPARAV